MRPGTFLSGENVNSSVEKKKKKDCECKDGESQRHSKRKETITFFNHGAQ